MIFCVLGAGYVGKAVLAHPLFSEQTFYATTRSQEKIKELLQLAKKAFLFQSDEKETLKKILSECDGVYILVAPQKNESYETAYLETAKSIEYALQGRTQPFFLLYTSSTFVYEGTQGSYLEEITLLTSKNPKANLLLETENRYLSLANTFIKVAILRLGGIYGPGRELTQRTKLLSNQSLSGTGKEPTNHIHLEDIVRAISFCSNHCLQGIFNLVNDDHPIRKELYETLSRQLHIPPPLWNGETPTHGSGSIISNKKIKQAGFSFNHPFLTQL